MGIRDDAHQAFVTLGDGTTIEGDVILAADGIHSRTRYSILADIDCPFDPIVSNITAYGYRLDALQVTTQPEAAPFVESLCSNVWIGNGVLPCLGTVRKANR